MDIIYLNDLEIETIIGIFDWERRVKQKVRLNLEMGADVRKAAATDKIEDTLNYKSVAKRLIEFVEESEFQLVETLAERVADGQRDTRIASSWRSSCPGRLLAALHAASTRCGARCDEVHPWRFGDRGEQFDGQSVGLRRCRRDPQCW